MPDERTRAVRQMRKAVLRVVECLDQPGTTLRVPRADVQELLYWLKHYPGEYDLHRSAMLAPAVWGSEAAP